MRLLHQVLLFCFACAAFASDDPFPTTAYQLHASQEFEFGIATDSSESFVYEYRDDGQLKFLIKLHTQTFPFAGRFPLGNIEDAYSQLRQEIKSDHHGFNIDTDRLSDIELFFDVNIRQADQDSFLTSFLLVRLDAINVSKVPQAQKAIVMAEKQKHEFSSALIKGNAIISKTGTSEVRWYIAED